MKRIILAVSVLVAAVLVFAIVSPALAAGPQQGGPGKGDPAGWGMNENPRQQSDQAGVGLNLNMDIQLDGMLEESLHQNLADALGISVEDIAAAEADGVTLSDVAVSLGFDLETFQDLLEQARVDALAEAVDSGSLSQEQADWLVSRGSGNDLSRFGESCLND